MFNLKPLSKDAIESALAKAERYRLLNEPDEAESICLDVLDVDPDNQAATVMLLLALSDQCGEASGAAVRAQQLARGLQNEYQRPRRRAPGPRPPETGRRGHRRHLRLADGRARLLRTRRTRPPGG
jgi:hypothetical protein